MANSERTRKIAEIELLEAKRFLHRGLPHLYAFPWYKWARDFFSSRNRFNFIVGPNQSSKSSTMIRKCIEWATNKELWPGLWRTEPTVFWYCYPSIDVADIEVRKKWVKEFLPRKDFVEKRPEYGWRLIEERGKVTAIEFESGVTVYFKAYTQRPEVLQTGTVYAMFVDEELPVELFPELKFRLAATSGYYHAAFTATLGQDFWRHTMEGRGESVPFPDAFKRQVSLYDCQYYEDGTPSFWTDKKIQEEIDSCPTQKEVERRVHGKFVKTEGLRYPSFDRLVNVKPALEVIPKEWLVYAGVDIGSGGTEYGHPAAIVFVGVSPDFRKARVFKHWNGKGIETTASDILAIFRSLRGNMRCAGQFYDYSSKDFHTIAQRAGESFSPADKTILAGDDTLNSLFKQQMLTIDDIPDNFTLVTQLENLGHSQKKTRAVDDSCFVAGTKVQTDKGSVSIEEIRPGDMILTRDGYRPCVAIGNRAAEVFDASFSDGSSFVVTGNHPVFTQNRGFVNAEQLTRSDTLLSFSEWQNQKRLFLTESYSGVTRKPTSSTINGISVPAALMRQEGLRACIEKFGNLLMGLFRRGVTYITRTETGLITTSPILSVYRPLSTSLSTLANTLKETGLRFSSTLSKLGQSPLLGIVHRKGLSYIGKMVSALGRLSRTTGLVVSNVVSLTRRRSPILSFVRTPAVRRPEEWLGQITRRETALYVASNSQRIDFYEFEPVKNPAPTRLVRLQKRKNPETVYNIRVSGKPEFFANGILVHNCDALRYCVMGIPWDWTIINLQEPAQPIKPLTDAEFRRKEFLESSLPENRMSTLLEQEIQEWNEFYEV